ncbi:MAG: S-layer homology domain-containing protein [Clostridia bacterium]|nr:S-layer homology domain-containing protein [Clostridia bacterium]
MKKIAVFILTLIIIISAVPISLSADTVDAKIYGPITIMNSMSLTMVGIDYDLASDDEGNYIHGAVKAGTYSNNKLMIVLEAQDFALTDYSYIKFVYRTDSTSKNIDVSVRSSAGESWMNTATACVGDGQWQEIIVNARDITGGAGAIPEGDIGVQFTLKPFNAGNVTLEKDHYFDLKYIACFKNKDAAEAYTFSASDDMISFEDIEYFYEKAESRLIDGYMAEMDAMISAIENSPTAVEVTGTKYYVSADGNNENDGLTPESAWKTVDKVNKHTFNFGDGVFFNRGDEWRTVDSLMAQSGVTYSAYGSGAKPVIISSVDGSGAHQWISTEYENVYAFVNAIPDSRDVATIVFDGGRAWGIQIQQTKDGDRLEIGRVYNGIEWFDTATGAFSGAGDLNNDLEFYHDWNSDILYLYSKDGNPGERFVTVEIVDKGNGIRLTNDEALGYAHDIVIDNIAVYGAGSHGIGGGTVKNVTVQYCTLEWIGGSRQFNDPAQNTRFGNAVESYGNSENFVIRDCYASQIYDCCWTVQISGPGEFRNIKMYNNVSEYCNSGLEVWQSGGTISGMDLYNNYTRFNGYGWSHQRPNKGGNFFYGGASVSSSYENNHVRNNVNLFASKEALLVKATGPKQYNFHDNVYVMESDLSLGGVAANPGLGTGAWESGGIKYEESIIRRAATTGFEKGSKFYYTEPDAYKDDMYDIYDPENGVDAFEDIMDNFWGRSAVDYVLLKGYFNGISELEFAPNGTMTRAMLVTVLSRIAGESVEGVEADYTDINKNAWYAPGVAWAEKSGIVSEGGAFRPDEKATREELADMLYRYALYAYRAPDLTGSDEFKDFSSVNAEYADGVRFCTANGIIGGYDDGTVRPKNSATRAEVATMIQRFNKYLATAPIDNDKLLENTGAAVIRGDELKLMLDNTGVRATTEGDMVKFVPFLESGAPRIRVMDMLNKDISLIEYPYIVVKFSGELNTAAVTATVDRINTANGATSATGIVSYASLDAGNVIIDISDYIASIETSTYADELAINIYPWGQNAVTLSNSEYFIINEVAMFESKLAAQAYAG